MNRTDRYVYTPLMLSTVIALGIGMFAAYDHFGRPATPNTPAVPAAVPTTTIGRQYGTAQQLVEAGLWDQWSDAIEQGKTMDAAVAELTKAIHDKTQESFKNIVVPAMSKIIAAGNEPDAEQRATLVKFGHDLATGKRKAVGK